MNRGIQIGDFHTAGDWDLILNSKSINPPSAKKNEINIDGRDGVLDLTEALTGEVTYGVRSISFVFLLTEGTYQEREDLLHEIVGYVNGQRRKIITDDDSDHYYIGRCEVKSVTNNNAYGKFTIEVSADPWYYSVAETVNTYTATSTASTITCVNNGIRSVTPTLVVTGDINITYGETSVALETGTYKLSGFKFASGSTSFSLSGTGTLTVKYREAIV